MVAVMVQVTGCCLYRSCVKTQTVTRAGTRALTLHCATTGHPVAPGTSATLAWHPSQQHRDRKQSHPHTPSGASRWGDQNSLFSCAKHLYLHILFQNWYLQQSRYINIGYVSGLRIYGSICPCYETRGIFLVGIWLDKEKIFIYVTMGCDPELGLITG